MSSKLITIKEQNHAEIGKRVRAVGMYFYKRGDLKVSDSYNLRVNPQNINDGACVEITNNGDLVFATLNRVAATKFKELFARSLRIRCVVLEEARWSRGDVCERPARAHKVLLRLKMDSEVMDKLDLDHLRKDYEISIY